MSDEIHGTRLTRAAALYTGHLARTGEIVTKSQSTPDRRDPAGDGAIRGSTRGTVGVAGAPTVTVITARSQREGPDSPV